MLSSDPALLEAQRGVTRLLVDVTSDPRTAVRDALGQRSRGIPYLAFFDRSGALVPGTAISGWYEGRSSDRVRASLAKSRR